MLTTRGEKCVVPIWYIMPGADLGEVKWVNSPPPPFFFLSPLLSFLYSPSNIEIIFDFLIYFFNIFTPPPPFQNPGPPLHARSPFQRIRNYLISFPTNIAVHTFTGSCHRRSLFLPSLPSLLHPSWTVSDGCLFCLCEFMFYLICIPESNDSQTFYAASKIQQFFVQFSVT